MARLIAVQLSLLAQRLLRAVAGLLGQHALAYVKDHTVQPRALPVLAKHRATLLGDPTDAAIGMNQPVGQRVRRALLKRMIDLNDHPWTIRG